MIANPHNDETCLGPTTEFMRRMLVERHHQLAELAAQFRTTRDVARWICNKPQLDDTGNPDETPKMYACRPPQRVRVFWETPNCYERTIEYILLAEFIDATAVRKMATVNTQFGRHTLPLENNRAVTLDPAQTRNALEGALFQLDRRPVYVTRNEALDWMATIAEEPAEARGEAHRVRNARAAMHSVMTGREITAQAIADIAYTVDEADREAPQFGARGRELHRRTAEDLTNALITQRRRNAGLDLQLENLLQGGATALQREFTQASRRASGAPPTGVIAIRRTSGGGASWGASSDRQSEPQTQIGKIGVGNPLLTELEKLVTKDNVKHGFALGGTAIGGPIGGVIGSLAGDALISAASRKDADPRNASWGAIKTPGVILDEIHTTQTAVDGLDRDITNTFREPISAQQRLFVDQWKAFVDEWKGFVGDHQHWYDRMWRGAYDKAIEFRESVLDWRKQFESLGGRPTSPPPAIPPDSPKPDPDVGPWKAVLLLAGFGAAAVVLPQVVRSFRSQRVEA